MMREEAKGKIKELVKRFKEEEKKIIEESLK